jgi:hypothetical protein
VINKIVLLITKWLSYLAREMTILFFKNKIKLEGEINNFDVKIYDKHLKIELK